jgi:hypothetical protein
MALEIADAEGFRPMLEAELRRHARQPVELLIVDDVAAWGSSRQGKARGNPPAMAITDGASGAWGILLRRRIDAQWVASIISRIEFGGSLEVRETLSTAELFARHLVLHELAHLENSWAQDRENDCDLWAFERLRPHAI